MAPDRATLVQSLLSLIGSCPDALTVKVYTQGRRLAALDLPAAAVAPDPTPEADQSDTLSPTEADILRAVGERTLTGKQIAAASGYSFSSHFRTLLGNLVERGLLVTPPGGGYRRASDKQP